MLIEKEVISPGTYFYNDEVTGQPRKLDVTPELCGYWFDQGKKMLAAGLTIPVPYEHDFSASPMTPKDKLLNNAGEVKEYRLKDFDDPKRGKVKDALFSVIDVQDPAVKSKIGRSIRWTSPWINSFTDGDGRRWNNVISHLALTTRPRITKQVPFGSIAAALSLAQPLSLKGGCGDKGFCLSRAGRIVTRKKTGRLQPQFPMAFSLISGGLKFSEEEEKEVVEVKDDGEEKPPEEEKPGEPPVNEPVPNPLDDSHSDVEMEELLCDLLNALGVHMPDNVGEGEFKRALYEAAMGKIKELTDKQRMAGEQGTKPDDTNKNTTSPAGQTNPLIQQEQQPMYMGLEEIQKLSEPMRSVALSMYTDNQRLRAEVEASRRVTDSLRDAKLQEAAALRRARITSIGRVSPRVKSDLESMAKSQSFALSMGDGGRVVDPMEQTLAVLEKGLADMPRLLTTDVSALSVQAQPQDSDVLTEERADAIADSQARLMGCAPTKSKR